MLPEREYIAVLQLALPMAQQKLGQNLTPANFDGKGYLLEVIEALASQRLAADPAPAPIAPVPDDGDNTAAVDDDGIPTGDEEPEAKQ